MEKYQNINVIYEDNHLLVVIKPANMPTCEDESKDLDLLTKLKEYLKIKYQKPGNVYLGLVHRLDRPTEGIIVFAKTSKAASRLSKQINEKLTKKTYYAVATGKLKDKDTLTNYLTKDETKNTSYVTDEKKGKLAILDYQTVGYKNNLSLLKINLQTGRHHQIRVQLSNINHPLYGDHKYNKEVTDKNKENIALIAKSLSFYHPVTKELLNFNIDLPKKYPWNLF